jgi:hypothetical protein
VKRKLGDEGEERTEKSKIEVLLGVQVLDGLVSEASAAQVLLVSIERGERKT